MVNLSNFVEMKEWIARWLAKQRVQQLNKAISEAISFQHWWFQKLIQRGRATAYGKRYRFDRITSIAAYQEKVPVIEYEAILEEIERMKKGEESVLWPGRPAYFAKTSGTTAGAKYIPVTKESVPFLIQGAKDVLFFYIVRTGNASFLNGKMIFLSGSPALEKTEGGIPVGRLSGISQHFVPWYLRRNRLPTYATNCIEDWEEKVERILDEVIPSDLRLISGIPPWVQMFFERLEARTGKKPIEVWPHLQLYIHGGVDFTPYRPIMENYFQGRVAMLETYPASEGFFAVDDGEGLVLMPNYGIFYEFVPLDRYQPGFPEPVFTLEEVEVNRPYALILTTNAGLWRYAIGDVVKFTSLKPYRVKVVGRVKHFLSAFGEHVIEEEVIQAIQEAQRIAGGKVNEFTVAPRIQEKGPSYHEWFVEFSVPPSDWALFEQVVDQTLQKLNPYYSDLRSGEILRQAQVIPLKKDASRAYMKQMGILGGQNKFPHLRNDRKIADFFFQHGWTQEKSEEKWQIKSE